MDPFDGIWALLDATGFTVHDGHVPDNPTFPYSVLWTPPGGRDSINNLAAESGRSDLTFRVTSVGETRESVRIIASAMHSALVDQRVSVAGWETYPIRHRGFDVPIQEDRQVSLPNSDRHPLYSVSSYEIAAEKS